MDETKPQERRDPANTGKILSSLEEHGKRLSIIEGKLSYLVSVEDLKAKLESHVKYREFLGWAAAAIVVVVGVCWGITTKAQSRAEETGRAAVAESRAVVATVDAKVDRNKLDNEAQFKAVQTDINEGRDDIRDVYRFLARGRRSERLEQPVKPTPVHGP